MEPKKPTFIIIGLGKCGTTALASILGAHPDCCISKPKEVNFFVDHLLDGQPNPNFERGWQWYKHAFAHYRGEPVIGEASPLYAEKICSRNAPKRIYDFNPDMKLIYMVRHPLERQISAWKMDWTEGINGAQHRGAKWALNGFDHWMRMVKENRGWEGCCYYDSLGAYLELFPAENVLVSFLEDWKPDKTVELVRIMHFLGLDPQRWPKNFQEEANRAEDRKIDRPFLKRVRIHPLTRKTVRRFPTSLRDWARNYFALTRAIPPEPDLLETTRGKFFSYIKPDIDVFLQRWGKPRDYWALGMHQAIS